MADNNLIYPAENNPNIIGLTPAKDREKKKRQNSNERRRRDGIIQDKIEPGREGIVNEANEDGQDKHSIDYCA